MEKMRMESVDMTEKNIAKIESLFPNCITETLDENGKLTKAINFDLLKQMLSKEIIDSDEAYEFTWVGKKAAIVEANKPIRKTLRPCIEESIDWDKTENLYIEGDNLDVLKLLQESYLGKIKMIYIDPPYNTGNDFIYKDDFTSSIDEYQEELGIFDENRNRLFKNTYNNGRFHSDWCSMIYSRIMLSRNLLSDDGVIFISIDDNEVDNLRKICDEIFGASNFIAHIIHKNNSMKNQSKYISVSTEFILIYCKNREVMNLKQPIWRMNKKGAADINKMFNKLKSQGMSLEDIKDSIMEMYSRPKYAHLSRWNKVDERGVFKDADLSRSNGSKDYTIINPHTGKACVIPNRGWGKSYEELLRLQNEDLIWYGDEKTPPGMKSYLGEDSESVLDNFIFSDTSSDKKYINKIFGANVFEFPKSKELIKQLVDICTDNNDIILDFFGGSSTTAHAVMELNSEDNKKRKFIIIQLPEFCDKSSEAFVAGYEKVSDIGRKRIEIAGEELKYNSVIDVGFRSFHIDSSNMNDIYYMPQEYNQDLLSTLESNIKLGRSDLDLLFGCLLEWGLPLSLPYNSEEIDGCTVHNYNNGDLVACFNENIPDSVIKHIAKKQPLRVVFRDGSFASSPAKINVGEIFKSLAPDTRVKVI